MNGLDFFVEGRDWRGEPRLLETEKAAALDWFPLEALPTPLVPHELFVLDRLRSGALPPIVSFGF